MTASKIKDNVQIVKAQKRTFTAAHATDVKLLGLFLNDFCSMQFYSKQIQMLHKNLRFCFL